MNNGSRAPADFSIPHFSIPSVTLRLHDALSRDSVILTRGFVTGVWEDK